MNKLLFFLISIFLINPSVVWAVYPNYTVCPSGGGCDFTTLEAAITDMSSNHATLDSPVTINITGTWSAPDTTAVAITGITTSATNTITINGNNQTGIWNTSDYIIAVSGFSTEAINSVTSYVYINYIQAQCTGTSGSPKGCIDIEASNNIVNGSITQGDTFGSPSAGFFGSGSPILFTNDLSYGNTSMNGFRLQSGASVYNSTGIGNGVYNFDYDSGGAVAENCLGGGAGSGDFSGSLTQSYNASTDTTASGTGSRISQTFTFVNATAKNYQITSTDTGAKGFGNNLSSTFTGDITGATRTVPWDIGAFKAQSGSLNANNAVLTNGVLKQCKF